MPELLIDGDFSRPTEIGPREFAYPFRQIGDAVTAHFVVECWQEKARWRPMELSTAHHELTDFFLIEESEPKEFMAGLLSFKRTYSRLPVSHTIPGSRFITKPDLPGEFPQVSGSSLIVQPDPNVPRWIFYTQKTVTSDSGIPTGLAPTGGTFTISFNGATTSGIVFNPSAATIQSAINGLATVSPVGGVTVTGGPIGFSLHWNNLTAATINAAGLTGGGGYTAAATSSSVVNINSLIVELNALPGSASFTGGTFTLTIAGQTTAAIAYNATTATVKSAVEALSNLAGWTVAVSNPGVGQGFTGTNILNNTATKIKFIVTLSMPAMTASGASLTPAGSSATVGTELGNEAFYPRFAFLTLAGILIPQRILGSAAHGIAATDDIVVTQGSNYRTITAGLFSVTTDTITLTPASGDAYADPTPITAVGKASGSEYTGGSKLTRIKRITDYWLPGVTPGIATVDDIPLPTYEGDAASLLSAIFAGDTDINYEVGELDLYRGGPIVQRTRTTIDATQL